MNKQIIDVTQCPYYKEDKTCTYLPYKTKCEGDCNWTAYKEMEEQLKAKEQECEKLKEQINCKCFDPKNNNNRCISYNRIAEDYEKDLKQLNKLELELKDMTIRKIDYLKESLIYKQTLIEIREIAKPYQRDIDKICGNCRRYDDCHACCMDDINCYQYKKGTTPACDKFMELKDFDINKLANQILQKISEVEE